jgi:hypothetical protein
MAMALLAVRTRDNQIGIGRYDCLMQWAFSSLDLRPRVRDGFGDQRSGAPCKTEKKFFDFVIGGVSLYDTLGHSRDLISALWNPPVVPSEGDRAIRRLSLADSGDASENRVSLFICPECGDLGCGAITVRIERDDTGIVWRDIGYENNYEPTVDLDSFATLGPFIFEPHVYVPKLEALFSKIERRPYYEDHA